MNLSYNAEDFPGPEVLELLEELVRESAPRASGVMNSFRVVHTGLSKEGLAGKVGPRPSTTLVYSFGVVKTKFCPSCGEDKITREFSRNSRRKDGLQSYCKLCSKTLYRKHYLSNYDSYLKRNSSRRRILREKIDELKRRPCVDCGGKFHPCAMDFDHLDPRLKLSSVADLVRDGSALNRVLQEISKCDLVCANCHRLRTYRRKHSGASSSG